MLEKTLNLNARCFPRARCGINSTRNFGRTLSCSSSWNPRFFTPAGYGTEVAEGKEVREFNGKMHMMEFFKADFAIVKVERRYSRKSNFKGTARNFNPCMSGARSPLLKWKN
jgi:acyl CoA:acetate/3-ketoacid CoA transferase alpha subunit